MTNIESAERPSPESEHRDCERFEMRLGPLLERELHDGEQRWMDSHRRTCRACAGLADEVESLMADASALPPLSPVRDLWRGIETRIEAAVTPIACGPTDNVSTAGGSPAPVPASISTAILRSPVGVPDRRTWSVRRLAIAATILVTASSVITWQITRRGTSDTMSSRGGGTGADVAALASTIPELTDDSDAFGDNAAAADVALLAAGSPGADRILSSAMTKKAGVDDLFDPDLTWDHQIQALQYIVEERFTELDSTTVSVLRRNLDIIDQAIADSRAALARDPASPMVSSQLDRSLQARLALMRRVVLL